MGIPKTQKSTIVRSSEPGRVWAGARNREWGLLQLLGDYYNYLGTITIWHFYMGTITTKKLGTITTVQLQTRYTRTGAFHWVLFQLLGDYYNYLETITTHRATWGLLQLQLFPGPYSTLNLPT